MHSLEAPTPRTDDTVSKESFTISHDPLDAFVYGIWPAGADRTNQLELAQAPQGLVMIPALANVNSSPLMPLAALRIAVKDIYNIHGFKTGGGSKALESVARPADNTAECIEKLVSLGAVIIGKAKTVQFASGMAAGDWEDYQCPINPRGCGYLDPDCSSSGSAAAVAGYAWLDFAVGSDSLGSIVGPASACGIFGWRPTQGVLSNKGALLVSSLLDTPGPFTRSISMLSRVARAWMPVLPNPINPIGTPTKSPRRILYPVERFSEQHSSKNQLSDSFIADLARSCNVQPIIFDIEEVWRAKGPDDISQTPLSEYLATTLATIQLYESFHNNAPFRELYEATFSGRQPPIDRMVQMKWELGAKITEVEHKNAKVQLSVFRHFIRGHVLTEGSIMLLPGGHPDVAYRLESTSYKNVSSWQGYGFKDTTFACLGGVPVLSFPVGQRSYVSKYTGQTEMQPVNMMMLGSANSDLWLVDLLEHVFKVTGRPLEVKPGKLAY